VRKNETPRHAGAQGKGANPKKTAELKYTLIGASEKLLGCLILAYQYGTLHEALENALPHLDGVSLPNRDGELLNALKYLAENNIPYDDESLKSAAQSVGFTDTATLGSYVVQAIDTQLDYLETAREKGRYLAEMAGHYAREARRAWLYRQIQAIASQLYNNPDSLPEVMESVQLRNALNMLRNCALPSSEDSADALLVPLAEWLADDSEQVEFLPFLGVDGLIARGTITLFGASPKGGGKTTAMVHTVRDWLQQGLKIVYLTEEPRAVWKLRKERFPELANPNLLVNAIPRANPYKWVQAIERVQPDVVIVDTIRRFLPARDENDSASVSEALTPFIDLAQKLPRTAIIFVHHTRKNFSADLEIADIAGSHAFVAEVDSVIALLPVRENKRQRILAPLAGRLWAFTPDPLVLELSEDGSTYTVLGIANEVLPESRAQSAKGKILQAVEALGQATAEEVAEYLREQGESFPKRTVQHYLAELYADGLLERESRRTRGGGYVYLSKCATAQSAQSAQGINILRTCALPESELAESACPSENAEQHNCASAQTAQAINALRTCALPSDAESPDNPPVPEDSALTPATFSLSHPINHEKVRNCETAPETPSQPADESPDNPVREDSALTTAYTHARALYRPAGDIEAIIERLQRNTEYPLSEDEAERMRAVYALTESLGYPALELPDWNLAIDATRVDWVNALPVLAGTDALDDALRALQALQNAESPDNPPISEDSEVLEGEALVQALIQVLGAYPVDEPPSRLTGEPVGARKRKPLKNGSGSGLTAPQLSLWEA